MLNNQMLRYLILLLFVMVTAVTNMNAANRPTFEEVKKQFPNAANVCLKRKVIITYKENFSNQEEPYKVTYAYHEELMTMTEPYGKSMIIPVYYSGFNNTIKIDKATAESYQNGRYINMGDQKITDEKLYSENIYEDDTRYKNIYFTGVAPGSVFVLDYTKTYKYLHFSPSIGLQPLYPVLEQEVEINYPASLSLKYFNENSRSTISLNQTENGNKKKLTYKGQNLNTKESLVRITLYVQDYIKEGKRNEVLANANSFAKWLSNLGLYKTTALPQSFIDSLCLGIPATDTLALAKTIYSWVQKNIYYIAEENGFDGVIPKSPTEVLNKRYGDCKGMSKLLWQMLSQKGIISYLAVVGTDDIKIDPVSYPISAAFNHLILLLPFRGQKLVLDATDNLADIYHYRQDIAGKTCLYITPELTGNYHTLPELNPDYQVLSETQIAKLEFDNKSVRQLKLNGTIKLQGEFAHQYKHIKASLPDLSLLKTVTEALAKNSHQSMDIKTASQVNPNDNDSIIEIKYDGCLKQAASMVGNHIIVNLGLLLSNKVEPMTPFSTIELDYKGTWIRTIKLQIPAGYKVDFTPSNADFIDANKETRFNYKVSKNELVVDLKIKQLKKEIGPDALTSYNNWCAFLTQQSLKPIILVKE